MLFFISRIAFLNGSAVFFDSPEYISRLSQSSLLNALLRGHWPYHFGYIFLFWPIAKLSQLFFHDLISLVLITQIFLAFFGVLWFYKTLEILKDKTTALKSSVIISLLPLFWITNSTIMVETAYITFFLGALYYFVLYLKKGIKNTLILSLSLFALAYFTNSVVLLWLPLFFVLQTGQKTKQNFKPFILIAIAIFLSLILEGYLISLYGGKSILSTLFGVYSSKNHEFAQLPLSFYGGLVYLRNFIIPLLRNNTILIVLLALTGLLKTFKKDKRFFWLGFFWIAPALITNQWSDSLFYGRQGLISSFGLVFLVSFSVQRRWFALLIFYLLLTSLPALALLRQTIPYLEEAKMTEDLPKESILFETHFARPQVEQVYKGRAIYVNEPGGEVNPRKTIEEALTRNAPVFISAQALSEPYGLYTGPYLHTLGLSYKRDYDLKSLLSNFELKLYKEANLKDNIALYTVIAKKKSPYPPINRMYDSKRRIDFTDPITRVWLLSH